MLDVARRAEELLRRVEGRGVHAAGQDPAAGRGGQVVGPSEPGDGVEQHDDVVAHLYQALGPLDRQFRDRGVVLSGPVEGGVDHFALDRPLHVGDLFWPFVHQDDHEVALGVVLGDRVGDGLQDHRLARLRRRHDEAALALADRGDQVDDPGGHDAGIGLQAEPVLRVQRHQLGELRPGPGGLRVEAIYLVQADQGVELLPPLPLTGLAHGALDDVALAQAVTAHLGQRHVDVVGPGQVAGGADERVVVEHVEDARDRDEHVVLGDHRLGVAAPLAAAPVAVAEPVPVATAAAAVVVIPAAALVLRAAAAAALVLRRTAAGGARVPALVGSLFRALAAARGVITPRVVVAAAPLTTLAVPRWLALAGSLAVALGAARAAAGGLAPGGRPAGGGCPAGVSRGERQLAGGGVTCRAIGGTGPRAPDGRDGLGALPWARLKRSVWFHSVLLTVAGCAGSRGRAPRGGMVDCSAGDGRAHGAGGGSALPALDRLDELALAHPANFSDAQGLRYPLQLRQQHAVQRTAL